MAATIPYLCRTHCPPQAGRGQPKRPQVPLHRGGGGDEAKQDQTGKATSPNKTTTLDRQGGIPWAGGEGGCGSPASYMYVCVYVYLCLRVHTYIHIHIHTYIWAHTGVLIQVYSTHRDTALTLRPRFAICSNICVYIYI